MEIDPITGLPKSNNTTVSTNTVITPESLNKVTPIIVPMATPDKTDYNSIIRSEISGLTNAANQAEADYQNQLAKASDISSQISNIISGGNQEADLQRAYQESGVNDLSAQLKKLNAQATGLNLEAQAIPIQLQQSVTGQGVTDRGLAPIEAGRLRENALKALSLSQQAAITQADYETAKAKADKMVDIQYKDREQALKVKQMQLDALKNFSLSPAQEKAKEARARLYKREEEELQAKKEEAKNINDMIIKASPYAPSSIMSKVKDIVSKGGSSVAVAQALGKYGGDYLGDLVKWSTINKNNAEYDKTMKEIKTIGQPLANNAPLGTDAWSKNNWANTAAFKDSLSAEERSTISKAFAITNQIAELQKNIQKDQTSFFGGKVRELMASIGQDAGAGTIQAQITALVPQAAKGIYGEVGVLTDQDTARYKNTLPNLTSPEAQNKAVTAMTLTALRNGVKSRLDVAAASKQDVSRFVPLYQELTNKINEINDESGVNKQIVIDFVAQNRANNPNLGPMVRDLKAQGAKDSEIMQILGIE